MDQIVETEIYESEIVIVNEENAGIRLDKVLADHFKEIKSRSYFQYLIENKSVKVNDLCVKKQYKCRVGDQIEVQFILTPELELSPEPIPLYIIYEDQYLLAINKPAGMVVHPAPGHWSGTFVNAFLYHCNLTKDTFGDESLPRPGIVHRLDKDTSGVLVAAKDPLTKQKLMELFASRDVSKEYVAVCCGNPGKGEVQAPIGRHPYDRKLMCVRQEGGKPSVTRYETLGTDGKISIVKIELITGRTHQIRVHMKHLGFPVLGDAVYGNLQMNKRYNAKRQLLHAHSLAFRHPYNQVDQQFTALFPEDIKRYFKLLHMEL